MAEQFYKNPSQKEFEGFWKSIFHFLIEKIKKLINILQKTHLISLIKVNIK